MADNKYWRVNEGVRAQRVRVIDSEGNLIGVMSSADAYKKAQEMGLDLVEIAPQAQPPVAKIIDFGKFKYREEKKLRKQKAKSNKTDVKEIRLSPFIAEGDYNTRLGRIKEFLSTGHKIRTVVKFKGRQMNSKKFGYEVLDKILKDIGEEVNIDMEPKFLGRHLTMVISPLSEAKKQERNEQKTKNKKVSD